MTDARALGDELDRLANLETETDKWHGYFKYLSDHHDLIVAALRAAPSPPVNASEDDIEQAILKFARGRQNPIKLTYESGPYDITKASNDAMAFARAILTGLGESGSPKSAEAQNHSFSSADAILSLPAIPSDGGLREALETEEKYLLGHFDAECGIVPGDVQGSFHRLRAAISDLPVKGETDEQRSARALTLRGLAEFFSESVHHVWSNDEIADSLNEMASDALASLPADDGAKR